jgi:hypothetical protein
MDLIIEYLFAPGCGARQTTLDLVARVTHELGLRPETREILVTSPTEAEQYHFLGSPSLRINGSDIEPGATKRTDFGLG